MSLHKLELPSRERLQNWSSGQSIEVSHLPYLFACECAARQEMGALVVVGACVLFAAEPTVKALSFIPASLRLLGKELDPLDKLFGMDRS